MKTKKAERIFKDTKYACAGSIRAWGLEHNKDGSVIGYNMVSIKDDETVSTRTLNDMVKLLNSERKQIEMSLRLGVITKDRFEERSKILDMVEATIRNTRKSIA